jgi:hypothetical protein
LKKGGWFGIGFGTSMTNTDMISFLGEGDNGDVVDQYASGHGLPQKDASQDVEWTSSLDENEIFIFEGKRKLVTGDSHDFDVELSKEMSMIWAEGPIKANAQTYHNTYGFFKLLIKADGSSQSDKVKGLTDQQKATLTHGIIMFTAWGIFGFMMCFTNRWGRHISNHTQLVHTVLGFSIMILSITAVAIKVNSTGLHLEGIHAIPGFIIVIVCIFVSLGGLYTLWFRRYQKWETGMLLKLK